jgi:transcriptional regulator with XRE-family HTH domain
MRAQIKGWLSANRRSEEWLAREVNCSVFHLSKILNGHRSPGASLVDRLAAVTGMELEVSKEETTNG